MPQNQDDAGFLQRILLSAAIPFVAAAAGALQKGLSLPMLWLINCMRKLQGKLNESRCQRPDKGGWNKANNTMRLVKTCDQTCSLLDCNHARP